MSNPMARKRLPIGVSSFSRIRERGYYYVDKTPLIIQLLMTSDYIFLSRPRRFGKSLTIDTIAELFSGTKKLFTGLYAENHWDWDDVYPVIRLSFAGEPEQGKVEALRERIAKSLRRNAMLLGVTLDDQTLARDLGLAFEDLIYSTEQKYGKQVVVLVD